MTVIKKERLFKIAAEINIGKDAIVAFLKAKGFEIENKPTQMLSEEMVKAVYDKFKKELRAAEVQREKIEKVNETRKVPKRDEWDTEVPTQKYEKPKVDFKKETPKTENRVVKSESRYDTPKAKENKLSNEQSQANFADKANREIQPKPSSTSSNEANVGDVIDLNKFKPVPKQKQQYPDKKKKIDDRESKKKDSKYENKNKPKTEQYTKEEREQYKKDNFQKNKDKQKDRKYEDKKSEVKNPKSEGRDFERTARHEQKGNAKTPDKYDKVKQKEQIQKTEEQKTEEQKTEVVQVIEKKEEQNSNQLKGLTVLGKISLDKKPEKIAHERYDRNRNVKKSQELSETERKEAELLKEKFKEAEKKKNKSKKIEQIFIEEKTHKAEKHKSSENPEASKDKRKDKKPRIIRDSEADISKVINASADKFLKITDKSTVEDVSKKHKPKIKVKAVDIEEETKKTALKEKVQKRKKKKKSIREMISKEDVDRAVRETLADMDSSQGSSNRQKMRQKRKEEKGEKILRELEESQKEASILKLTEFVSTGDLARMMNISPNEIILKCMELGLMVSINQRLDKDTLILIADDYGYEIQFVDEKQLQFIDNEEDEDENLKSRPPIVTIMGHVDHGKTSLLDNIRKANVVAGEAGGITQHIGAYTVKTTSGKSITFLDTPGHEAFTAMRARGAQATDLVVLVVAADDSVMPQTIEAISHSKAANVPIVVAINKIDKQDANPDRIKQQLTDYGILVEEWGGTNQCAEISAKKGLNIEVLLEKILIESEMLDLKANPDRLARGVVIESSMSKGFGSVATIIVQKGTLNVGDAFVSGTFSGRVRAMLDDNGNKIESAGPSKPVVVIGYDGLPEAGDGFMVMKDESDARRIANERKQLKREQEFRQVHHITLDEISAQIQIGGVKDLNLVIKADVAGSLEALSDSLQKLSTEEVRVNILHKGVGPISETDVMLAAASQAVVIAFNINPTTSARKAAEKEFVDIRKYDIIYDCINEVQLALEGLLAPELIEKITATVEVRQTFKISRIGTIAGCMVLSGKITRNDKVRLLRDGFKVFEGSISSLKREKDDAREVLTNFECGIMLHNYNDLKEGDIIEAFTFIEKKRTLS